jgi:two-component system, NtrC family, sensor kinase
MPPQGSLRSILARLPDFVLRVDAAGTIRYINRDGTEHTRDELIGTQAVDHIGEQRASFERAFHAARETGAPQFYDVTAYTRAYAVWLIPQFEGSVFAGATLVATDMSELQALVARVSSSEEKTRAVIRAFPDIVFLLDRAGTYLDFKAEQARDLAAPPETITGQRIRDVLPPDVAQQCLDGIEHALATREVQVFEYQLDLPHGVQDFEARMVASGPEEVVCLVRNMTNRKRLEQQLAAADRLASLGTLVAGVAHEMNNPLSYLLLNLRSAERMVAAWEAGRPPSLEGLREAHARLERALEGGERMQQIMQNLTTFSNRRSDEISAVDVPAVLDWAIGMVESHLERAVITRRYEHHPRVCANRESLGQVFVNLLLNAAQALPAQAATAERAEVHEVAIATRGERDRVVIEISDTGSGILPEHRARIFEPFFTTKPVGVGTGLGLWICHNIVTGHGGSIDVDSVLGKGTTVRVVLPAAAP